MRTLVCTFLTGFLATICMASLPAIAQDTPDEASSDSLDVAPAAFPLGEDLPRELSSLPYGPGESITFELGYGVITAGEATIMVVGLVDYYGQPSIHLRTRARSNGFFDAFYKVRDQADSYADADSLFARYFNKHLREGGYERDVEIHFDQTHGVAYYPDGRESEAPRGTHDIITSFFRVRTLPLVVGDVMQMPAHGDKRLYPLEVRVLRKERIKTIFGNTDCVVVQPVLLEEGLFNHQGDLFVWFTDDERRIPVLMRASVPVGAIEARLTRYTPGGSWE
jgi:hypothetical protein